MACSDITRCDNSLTAAAIDVVLDASNVVSYGECTIDGIKLGDRMLVDPNSTAEDLCKRLRSFKKIKGDRKWKDKAQKTDKDNLNDLEGKLCDLLKNILPEPSSNSGGGGETEVIAEPETIIYGCLDRKASNWYCLENDCVGVGDDRKPPKGIQAGDCITTKEYDIKNKYVFCNTQQGCFSDTEHKVTPTLNKVTIEDTGTLEGQPRGVIGHIDSVYNSQKDLIQTANKKKKFLYLKKDGEPQGFYVTSTWDETLVNEFAAALTIEIFKTQLDGNSTFPFQRVTIFSPDSRLLGHFSIVPNTNVNGEPDSIASLSGKEGSRLINYRLKFHVGTQILDLNNVGVYRNALDSGGGKFDSSYSLDNEGRIIKDPVTEGLVSILKEKPIGLAKLLK